MYFVIVQRWCKI